MKRLLALLLAVLMLVLALAGCGESPAPETPQPPAPAEPTEPPVPLEGEYIPLTEKTPEKWLCAALEFEDRFLIIYRDGSSEAFSLKDGALLSETAPMEGTLLGAEKSTEKEGYDYVLRFFDRLVWKNSRQPEKGLEEPLPFECPEETPDFSFQNRVSYYDIGETYFLYAAPDGIHRVLRDGSEDVLLLRNADLPPLGEFLEQQDPARAEVGESNDFPLSYVEPRFMLNESKLAVAVWSPDRERLGCFVCDLETGEPELGVWGPAYWYGRYPVEDRYVVVSNYLGIDVTDVVTKETRTLEYAPGMSMYRLITLEPFCAIIQQRNGMEDYTHFQAAMTYDFKTMEEPFIRITDDVTSGWLGAATEHYVLLSTWNESEQGRENTRVFLLPYKE